MHITFLLPVLLLASSAIAQCCCADLKVELRTPFPVHQFGKWNYTAHLDGERAPDHWRMDSVPGDAFRMVLEMPTGCGLKNMIWTVFDKSTKQVMEVDLRNIPGDVNLPTIAIPFTLGKAYFNLQEIQQSVAGLGGRWNMFSTDSLYCSNGGKALYTYDAEHGDRLEPFDIGPWTSIATVIPDEDMTINPVLPKAGKGAFLNFRWYDGTCASYRDSVEVRPVMPGAMFTEIRVGIGQVGVNCENIAPLTRTVGLPPLPQGKYRIVLGAPPAGTTPVLGFGRYRDFEVGP